jgi:hypothetical protein
MRNTDPDWLAVLSVRVKWELLAMGDEKEKKRQIER